MRVPSPSCKRHVTSNCRWDGSLFAGLVGFTVAGGSITIARIRSKSLTSGPRDTCSLVRALVGWPLGSRSRTSTFRTTSEYQVGYPSTASSRARHSSSGAATTSVAAPWIFFIWSRSRFGLYWRAMCSLSSASGSLMSSPLRSTVTLCSVPVKRNGAL